MSRISEERRNEITVYASELSSKDPFYGWLPLLAEICISIEEVDAAIKTYHHIIESHLIDLKYAKHIAPHDPKRKSAKFEAELSECKDEGEIDNTISYMEQVEPIYSKVKIIKGDVIDDATFFLRNAGIGKKRINKIIPILMEALNDEEVYKTYTTRTN